MAQGKNKYRFHRDENDLLAIEADILGPCAQLSEWATYRNPQDKEGRKEELRTAFQHDRDRVIHSRAFRRLKHKTQVFIPYKNDHQRTRLTHTIEVMQISRTISRCLGLNEDLTEAIAMAHDLGHTPFGHVGERTIIRVLEGKDLPDLLPKEIREITGSFKHNAQSIRVVDLLESRYEHPGLNLSDQTREGILKHTSWQKWKNYPGMISEGLNLDRPVSHFEGQVVAIADEIAQQTHDLEDGLRFNLLKTNEITDLMVVQYILKHNPSLHDKKMNNFLKQNTIIRSLIHLMVVNAIHASAKKLTAWCDKFGVDNHLAFFQNQQNIKHCISFSDEFGPYVKELQVFVKEKVIKSKTVVLNDESGQYFITKLFELFYNDPSTISWFMLKEYADAKKIKHLHEIARFSSREEVEQEIRINYHEKPDFIRLIADYIAGMSNTYAIREYEKYVMPLHI